MLLRAVFTALFLSAGPALAEQTWRSAPTQAVVLELYTSEGCSSCPPADRWFSGLLNHPDLWDGLVPLAFHVDYWNYLGWEDRFARAAYGQRQRNYRRQGNINGVYTPGVLATGQEWRSWRQRPGALPPGSAEVGVLELRREGDQFSATFEPAAAVTASALRLHVAVLGFGLSSPVKAGENRGRTLQHDFVVLAHSSFKSNNGQWTGRLPDASLADQAQRLGLVAWISEIDRQGPVQAVGGWW